MSFGPRLRLLALGAAVGSVFAVLAISGSLSTDRVRDWVDAFGWAGPVAFVLLGAGLVCAVFPLPLLAGASGLLFGTAVGFPVTLVTLVLGAVCAFSISRRFGARAVEELAGVRLRRWQEWLEQRGFYAIFYVRIAPGVPHHVVNYAAGLSRVRLLHFAAATAIGGAPRAFAYTALGGSFGDLSSPETLVAIGILLVMAVVGALALRRDVRRSRGGEAASFTAGSA